VKTLTLNTLKQLYNHHLAKAYMNYLQNLTHKVDPDPIYDGMFQSKSNVIQCIVDGMMDIRPHIQEFARRHRSKSALSTKTFFEIRSGLFCVSIHPLGALLGAAQRRRVCSRNGVPFSVDPMPLSKPKPPRENARNEGVSKLEGRRHDEEVPG